VVHRIEGLRYTALKVGGNILMELSIATNRSVWIIVTSTATRITMCYVMNFAIATHMKTWIVISAATTI
jgi:hypothetical protein